VSERSLSALLRCLCLTSLVACGSEAAGPNAPADDPRLLIPWPELSGRIVYGIFVDGAPRDIIMIDATQQRVRKLFALVPPLVPVDYALSNKTGDLAVRFVVPMGTLLQVVDSNRAVKRGIDYGDCGSWLTDGRLAYTVFGDVFLENERVTSIGLFGSCPAWAPDGSYFLYTYRVGNTMAAFKYTTATKRSESFFAQASGFSLHRPVPSPDGSMVAVLRNSQLVVVKSDGTGERVVAEIGSPDPAYDWAWSPDGRYLAVNTVFGRLLLVRLSDGDVRRLVSDKVAGITWAN
jgi:hypothetical protein